MKNPNEFPADIELTINIRIKENAEVLGTKIFLSHALIHSGGAGRAAAAQLVCLSSSARRIIESMLALERDTISEGVKRKRVFSREEPEITRKDIDEFIKAAGFYAAETDRK